MPGWVSPSSPVTHTLASTRRTPSTNTTTGGSTGPGDGVIGAQSATGRSTVRSTGTSVSAIAPASFGEPYSGAQASTANLIAPPAPPSSRGRLGGPRTGPAPAPPARARG